MKNLEAIKTAGQERIHHLVDLGKQQPSEVQTWGVTAIAAVAGGLILVAGAQVLLALVATLASPPVSITVGAIGGGALGWRGMQRPKAANKTIQPANPVTSEAAPTYPKISGETNDQSPLGHGWHE